MRKKRNTAKKAVMIVIVLGLFIFSSYRPKPKVFEKEYPPEFKLGTTVQIKLITKDEFSSFHAYNAAISAIDNANKIFNSYTEDSEISKAVEAAKSGPVEISAQLYYILNKSLEINKLSNGAFDITISNLTALWKSAQKNNKMPEVSEILDVLNNRTGIDKIILTAPKGYTPAKLEITNPNIKINVSAIAKGYITDLAAKAMQKVPDVYAGMVNIGGEIVCFNNSFDSLVQQREQYTNRTNEFDTRDTDFDPESTEMDYQEYMDNPPEPSPYMDSVREYQAQTTYSETHVFPIGITNPFRVSDSTAPESHSWVVNLTNHAIATSGNYRQYFEIDNQKYSHIIDPRTGYPAKEASGTTVIARTCMQADALATALSVMHPDEALALAESIPDVEAMIIYGSEDNLEILKTTLFDNYLRKNK